MSDNPQSIASEGVTAATEAGEPTVPAPELPVVGGAQASPASPSESSRKDWLLGLLLLAVTLLAYQPVWHAGFVWDDGAHLTWPELRSWHGLVRIWTEIGATQQYYPLVHTFFWIEYQLWGDAPLGYHLVNVAFHLTVALLLVKVLRQLEIPGAWLTAFIFALHPVEVESVAWVSELKNTLSAVCYLGSALFYLRFDRERKTSAYLAAFGLFIFGLFAKTVIATLPAALLLVFCWQRKKLRWKEDVAPLIPFFVTGMGMGMLTSWMERALVIGTNSPATHLTLLDRSLICGRAIWFYLGKLVWPAPLDFVYPRWTINASVWWQYLFPLAALLLLVVLWAGRRRFGSGPLVALLFFVGTLFPALGFFDVFPFRYSFVADHFQYLAGIGPLALLGAVISQSFGVAPGSRLSLLLCAALLAALGILTFQQSGAYQDEETLWRANLSSNPDCSMAHDNLGLLLLNSGRDDEALQHFQASVALYPQGDVEQNDLASALIKKDRYAEAIPHLQSALAINPAFFPADANLALAYWKTGKLSSAEHYFQSAIRLDPNNPNTLMNLGGCLAEEGKLGLAATCDSVAARLAPSDPEPLRLLAGVLGQAGRFDQAIPVYQHALRLAPADQDLLVKLGVAYINNSNYPSAADCFHKALQAAPANPMLHYNLGGALALEGKIEDARHEMAEAVRLKPDFTDAQTKLNILSNYLKSK